MIRGKHAAEASSGPRTSGELWSLWRMNTVKACCCAGRRCLARLQWMRSHQPSRRKADNTCKTDARACLFRADRVCSRPLLCICSDQRPECLADGLIKPAMGWQVARRNDSAPPAASHLKRAAQQQQRIGPEPCRCQALQSWCMGAQQAAHEFGGERRTCRQRWAGKLSAVPSAPGRTSPQSSPAAQTITKGRILTSKSRGPSLKYAQV